MSVQYLTIANGQAVSSAFTIDRDTAQVVIAVPSHAALGWRLEWAWQTTGPWAPQAAGDGLGGAAFVGFSGAAGAFFKADAFTRIGRIRASGNVSATMSVAVVPWAFRS